MIKINNLMNKIDEIINAINLKIRDKDKVVVLIDGRGGSGKSTLSQLLADQLSDTLIINLDLYTVSKIDLYDPINIGKNFEIDFKNLEYDEDSIDILIKKVSNKFIIIEGCFSFKNIQSIDIDFKIWVEIEKNTARDRLNYRERNDKGRVHLSTEVIELATKMWQKSEDEYINEFNPIINTDFVYHSN